MQLKSSEAYDQKTGITSGGSRNMLSLNLASYGANSESTLQLDTIGPVRPMANPQSTKNQDVEESKRLSSFEDQWTGLQSVRHHRIGTTQINIGMITP